MPDDKLIALAERAAAQRGPAYFVRWMALRFFGGRNMASADLTSGLGMNRNFCGECGRIGSTNPDTDNCASCDAALRAQGGA